MEMVERLVRDVLTNLVLSESWMLRTPSQGELEHFQVYVVSGALVVPVLLLLRHFRFLHHRLTTS